MDMYNGQCRKKQVMIELFIAGLSKVGTVFFVNKTCCGFIIQFYNKKLI